MPQVLCFGKKNLVYIAVSGGQGPIFSRLILVVRKKGIAGILGFLSPMMLKEDRFLPTLLWFRSH